MVRAVIGSLATLLLTLIFLLVMALLAATPAGKLVVEFPYHFVAGYLVLIFVGIICVVRLECRLQNRLSLNLHDFCLEAKLALGFLLFAGFLFLVVVLVIRENLSAPVAFAFCSFGSCVLFFAGIAKIFKLRKLASSVPEEGAQYTSWQCPGCLQFNDPNLLACSCGYRSPQTTAYAD